MLYSIKVYICVYAYSDQLAVFIGVNVYQCVSMCFNTTKRDRVTVTKEATEGVTMALGQ